MVNSTNVWLDVQHGKGLAILTCMDCRIDPLALGGLSLGDVKVVRNAGAQLDETATHDLVLASHLLDVNRILILPHTRCAMATATDTQMRAIIKMRSGLDASNLLRHGYSTDTQRDSNHQRTIKKEHLSKQCRSYAQILT